MKCIDVEVGFERPSGWLDVRASVTQDGDGALYVGDVWAGRHMVLDLTFEEETRILEAAHERFDRMPVRS